MRISDWSSDVCTSDLGQANSPEEFREAFTGRLAALAQAHELLIRTNWEGADLRGAAERALAPFGRTGTAAWRLEGPPVRLQPKQALVLTLVLHELATNAAKYGALSTCAGRSEARRVGEEGVRPCRSRWSPSQYKQNTVLTRNITQN